ncbi:conserved exported hypothetical protein [Verrucomicrobia bacterium]|nr:conserved exported hypothetical protein [Verrucomicrobiota bacterium]
MNLFRYLTIGLVLSTKLEAQTLTVLSNLGGDAGDRPQDALVLESNTLYGTTWYQGPGGNGTIFKVNTDGTGFAVLHSSISNDCAHPRGLIVCNGTLYGSDTGSASSYGSIFSLNADGSSFTNLKVFSGSDGAGPIGGLARDGNTLYGVTVGGGSATNGTIFKLNTDGTGFTTIYTFTPTTWSPGVAWTNCDGADPSAGLTLSGSTLFGTTQSAGMGGAGTVFKLNTDGSSFVVLHPFSYTSSNLDGELPQAQLLLSGGVLYGTTQYDTSGGAGTLFRLNTDGSGFAVLHQFTNSGPLSGVILGAANTLYGTVPNGGIELGVAYQVNTDGTGFTVLHNFSWDSESGNWDGGLPLGGLILSGNTLYGTAAIGGTNRAGTVFALQLPPPAPPLISGIFQTNGNVAFTWNASAGVSYQVQYRTDFSSTTWANLGSVILATNNAASATDPLGTGAQRFYRVVRLPH